MSENDDYLTTRLVLGEPAAFLDPALPLHLLANPQMREFWIGAEILCKWALGDLKGDPGTAWTFRHAMTGEPDEAEVRNLVEIARLGPNKPKTHEAIEAIRRMIRG